MSNEKLFFYDSLIEIYEVPKQEEIMWGFSLIFDNKREDSGSLSYTPEDAVSDAKLHALENFILKSPQLRWITMYESDEIFLPSPNVIKRFGDISEWRVANLYHKRSDRADFLQKVAIEGTASSPIKMFSLNGEPIHGTLTSQLIQLDEDTAVLLEEFELRSVAA